MFSFFSAKMSKTGEVTVN